MKILFYPSLKRLFLTTGVFYFFQLIDSKLVDKVTLLLEFDLDATDIDSNYLKEKIISGKLEIIECCSNHWGSGFEYHKNCKETIKQIVKYNFDIIFMPDDIYIMNNYLLHMIKFKMCICYQTASTLSSVKKYQQSIIKNITLHRFNIKLMNYGYLGLWLLKLFYKHFKEYYIFPFINIGVFFSGSKSLYLRNGDVGEQCEYYIVFSLYDKNACLEDGVNEKELVINGHPLQNRPELYEKVFSSKLPANTKYDITYFQTDIGIKDYISYYNQFLIPLLVEEFNIAIKLHPNSVLNNDLMRYFDQLGNTYNFTIAKDDNFYKLSAESEIIIGETTSVLETISFLFAKKKIISINMLKSKICERYKNHDHIIYVDEYNVLKNVIENKDICSSSKQKPKNTFIPIDYLLRDLSIHFSEKHSINTI